MKRNRDILNLYNKEFLIAEIEAWPVTRHRLGGYNSRPYSLKLDLYEGVKPQTIKGIWRWWARTFISACLGGETNYNEVNKELDKLLGSSSEIGGISKFILKVSCSYNIKKISEEKTEYKSNVNHIISCSQYILGKLRRNGLTLPPNINLYIDHSKLLEKKLRIVLEPAKKRIYKKLKIKMQKLKKEIENILCIELIRKKDRYYYDFDEYDGRTLKDLKFLKEIAKLNKIPRYRILFRPRTDMEDSKLNLNYDNVNLDKVRNYLNRLIEEIVHTKVKFNLKLYVKPCYVEPNVELINYKANFSVITLILSILLGGIGSIHNRAVGSYCLKIVNASNILDKDVIDIINNRIYNCTDPKNLKELIYTLIEKGLENAKEIFPGAPGTPVQIPSIPTISSDLNNPYFKLIIFECRKKGDGLLRIIGNSCLKVNWKRGRHISGKGIDTWILGIPRANIKQKTGYYINDASGRRQSSIGFSILLGKQTTFILIYGFLSRDWPPFLKHKGKDWQDEIRTREKLVTAFNEALSNIENYIGEGCGAR